MENASKALLIAGTIIVGIAVISIATLVFYKISAAINNIDVDSTAVTIHNTKFSEYVGKVTGSQVKICISNALANNYNEDTKTEYKIKVKVDDVYYVNINGKTTDTDKMSTNIKVNTIYNGTVTFNQYGIISEIEFTK